MKTQFLAALAMVTAAAGAQTVQDDQKAVQEQTKGALAARMPQTYYRTPNGSDTNTPSKLGEREGGNKWQQSGGAPTRSAAVNESQPKARGDSPVTSPSTTSNSPSGHDVARPAN